MLQLKKSKNIVFLRKPRVAMLLTLGIHKSIGFCFLFFFTFAAYGQVKEQEEFRGIGAKVPSYQRNIKKDSIVSVIPDSLRSPENDIETTVVYDAQDSTIMDVGKQEVYLYGEAEVTYGDIVLKADYIKLNWDKAEVFAHGLPDSTEQGAGKVRGKPIFTQGAETYNTDTIRYNFKSKKAIIKGIVTQQGEGIIQGEKVKKDPIDNLYLSDAKYSTCNLAEPHFHIAAKKIKLVNKKSIVSGPFNLVLADIPLPIGLPFGFFPVPKKKEIGTSGFIMGNYGEEPNNRGFYLRDFGYYHAFNEYIGAKVLAQVYSRGSWGVGLQSNYTKRYKVNGNVNIQYNYNKPGDDFSTTGATNDFNVSWSHSPQSRRSDRSFSMSVNVASNGFNQNNRRLDEVDNYTSNTSGSSVQFTRNFGKLLRTSWGLRADQNFSTKVFNSSMSYNIALNQFNPFVPEKLQTGKWYESFRTGLNVSGGYRVNNSKTTRSTTYTDYNIAGISNTPITNEEEREITEIQNLLQQRNLSDAERAALQDRLAELTSPVLTDFREILDNGIFNNSFSVPIALPNFKIAKYINVTPSISYRGDVYTKSLSYEFLNPTSGQLVASNGTIVRLDQTADEITSSYVDGNLVVNLNPNSGGVVVVDTTNGVAFGQSLSYGTSMNTRFYGTYNFKKNGRLKAIRHTVAPSISLSYTPDNSGSGGYAVRTVISETDSIKTERYLPRFIGSSGGVSAASGNLSFGITNQLEAKIRSKSDTAETEFEKISLLDNFSIQSGYNLFANKDLGEFALSNVSLSTNTSLFKNLISINANASLDPYAYEEDEVITSNLAGKRIQTYKWNYKDGDGGNYLNNANLSISTRLSPKTLRKEKPMPVENDPVKEAMEKFIAANPLAYVDFSIPWSFNIGYNINYSKQGLADPRITQTLNFSGDLSLTEKWKVSLNSGWDFEYKAVTLTNISLLRELHCWDMSFNWTPIAGNAQRSSNYSFDLRVRSSLLSDLRVSRRRQYYDRGGF
ncbi:hypothetical protein SAMN06298216_1449 [Spirosomataceae bacterium TFI 002]|nr:hypothetical protein SAMN06298216_1449 [Spirosomataceae bacterium TFI 002]